jgi:hypothetical protein
MTIEQAIDMLSQSDPIVKLLQQVKLGRMKADDAGLRAITESWLETYQRVLESARSLDRAILHRLDPSPRLDVLEQVGILPSDHQAATSLRKQFDSLF